MIETTLGKNDADSLDAFLFGNYELPLRQVFMSMLMENLDIYTKERL